MSGSHPSRRRFGFNVFGYITGTFGQVVVTRNTLRVLLERGYPVCTRDTSRYDGRAAGDHPYPELECRTPTAMPYAINLYQSNPPETLFWFHFFWSAMRPERRFNAIVPFWELPVLPEVWKRGLAMMDAVLAPSLYVADIVRREVPGVKVIHFPQAVYLPEGVQADRERWGLADGTVAFLAAFDVTSDVGRKNPWGTVEAFRAAFRGGEDAVLVLKLNTANAGPEHARDVERLRALAREDERIRIIEAKLPYRELLGLFASCDAIVSLHRAEGLNLVLMEAMSLGKPVIATGWSGNMDYTNETNACLVGYELIPLAGAHPAYAPELFASPPVWADPSVDDAAASMRRLYDDPELRRSLGTKAAEDMRLRRERHASGETFEELERFYEEGTWRASHPARAAALRKYRVRGWLSLAVRLPRGILKRAARAARGTRPA